MNLAVGILALLAAASARAQTLETPSYIVTIEQRCPQGHVGCEDVVYTGRSKRSGKSITLRGSTVHATCRDGVTPCAFRGYRFRSGQVRYIVDAAGTLLVQRGDRTLVRERGEWK